MLMRLKAALVNWAREVIVLPEVPKAPSWREAVADWTFILLRFLGRYGIAIGAAWGWLGYDIRGLVYGLLLGAVGSFWIRSSLALRGRNLTTAFYLRMYERAHGSRKKLLESFLERLRGQNLTPDRCRRLAYAYQEAEHHLQTSSTDAERNRVLKQLEERVIKAKYGQLTMLEPDEELGKAETGRALADA